MSRLRARCHAGGRALIASLVASAIIAIPAASLFPLFAKACEMARMSSCQSDLTQMAIHMTPYTRQLSPRGAACSRVAAAPLRRDAICLVPVVW